MKIFLWLVLSFLLSASNAFANEVGKGDLKLTNGQVNYFITYLKGGAKGRSPSLFTATKEADWAMYWYCSPGLNRCHASKFETTECKRRMKKRRGYAEDCFVFAEHRRVVWDNGNNSSVRERLFNSKMSEQEVRDKLTQLGFLGSKNFINKKADDAAFEKETKKYREDFKKKIDKKNKTSTKKSNNKIESNIVTQLKALTDLNKQGAISDEEFKLAKQKLLAGN